ncbi:hypothetical protein [Pantoea agglomerans]|uniref:hypothetical protein n=1 Tax=Enterobacter agglomerans TaxID=549 RepID=UPI0011B0B804|nr:hypothetical protein [Pantoea agglomerans]UBN55509.1 hypothetical protein LB453_08155 [Pantoea agglomerans]
MNEILSKRHTRNFFYSAVVIGAVLILLIRFFLLPIKFPETTSTFGSFLALLLNGVVTSLIVTTIVGSFLYWVLPESLNNSKIEIEAQSALKDMFQSAFSSSEIWYYKGGCGRYFRTKTLPELARAAREKSQSREILVVILDPTNDDVCKKHAIYRSGMASQQLEKNKWDLSMVQAELFATIVSTVVTQVQEPLLRISISLCPHYSSFRIDLSDKYAVITKEDRNAPAIICHKGSYFYNSYKDEVILSLNQSSPLTKIKEANFRISDINALEVKSVLSELNIHHASLDSNMLEKIAKICRENDNPYV